MNKARLAISAGVLAVALCAATTRADIAFAPSGEVTVPGEPSGNDALYFTPNVDITVTDLGYFDPQTDISFSHEVGLYTAAGVLLASTTIYPNTGPDINDFRYSTIASVTLQAGQTYAVDGFYSGPPDVGVYARGGVGADPLITYDYYRYDYNGSLDLANVAYRTAIFGPNFEFTAVPEPTTIIAGASMLLPFGAGALRMLRKKQSA